MWSMTVLKSRAEWLEYRHNFIGGSDASSILGLNPWKSNVDLWEEKFGLTEPQDISNKSYVEYGTKAETHLRELFALDFPQYDVKFVDNNLWQNSKHPFAHASLDGWLTEKETGRKGILEIKTTEILNAAQREKWGFTKNHPEPRIPDNYYIQVLHYLMVTEFDFAILKVQMKSTFGHSMKLETRHYHIERSNVEDDIQYLLDEERKFWSSVKTGRKPALILPEL